MRLGSLSRFANARIHEGTAAYSGNHPSVKTAPFDPITTTVDRVQWTGCRFGQIDEKWDLQRLAFRRMLTTDSLR